MHNKKIIFSIYLFVLIVFIIVKFNGSINDLINQVNTIRWNRTFGIWNANLIPFRTITDLVKHMHSMWAIKSLLANIIAFIPWGFFLPHLYKRYYKFVRFLFLSFIFVVFIELFQFITMLGYFDIDDILLNLTGCLIGYLINFLLLH